jgi:catechol 2,3-dioxygenase-like lactoylglutathione lyase family enzyme
MPISTGFNHVATLTDNLDRVVDFYRTVFDAELTFEKAATADHPRWRSSTSAAEARSTSSNSQPTRSSVIASRRAGVARSTTTASPSHPRAILNTMRDRLAAAGADIGEIQRLGDSWSLFFRDPDGMELEVCAPI